MEARSISILKNSFSPSLVPEMSSPVAVVILSLTPGAGAVLFKTDDGVDVVVTPPTPIVPLQTRIS